MNTSEISGFNFTSNSTIDIPLTDIAECYTTVLFICIGLFCFLAGGIFMLRPQLFYKLALKPKPRSIEQGNFDDLDQMNIYNTTWPTATYLTYLTLHPLGGVMIAMSILLIFSIPYHTFDTLIILHAFCCIAFFLAGLTYPIYIISRKERHKHWNMFIVQIMFGVSMLGAFAHLIGFVLVIFAKME